MTPNFIRLRPPFLFPQVLWSVFSKAEQEWLLSDTSSRALDMRLADWTMARGMEAGGIWTLGPLPCLVPRHELPASASQHGLSMEPGSSQQDARGLRLFLGAQGSRCPADTTHVALSCRTQPQKSHRVISILSVEVSPHSNGGDRELASPFWV